MEQLPDEILLKIAGGLTAEDLFNTTQVGPRLRRVFSDRSLWESGSFQFPNFNHKVFSLEKAILELCGHHFRSLDLRLNLGDLDAQIFNAFSFIASCGQLIHLSVVLWDSADPCRRRALKTSSFKAVLDLLAKASKLKSLTLWHWPTRLLGFKNGGVRVPQKLCPSLEVLDVRSLTACGIKPLSSADIVKLMSNFHSFKHLKVRGGMLGEDLIHTLAAEGRLESLTVDIASVHPPPPLVSGRAWNTLTSKLPQLDVQLDLNITGKSCRFHHLAEYFLRPEVPVVSVSIVAHRLPDVDTIFRGLASFSHTLKSVRFVERHRRDMYPGRLSYIFNALQNFISSLSDEDALQSFVFEGRVEPFDPMQSNFDHVIPEQLYTANRKRKIYWIHCSDRKTLLSGARFEWG